MINVIKSVTAIIGLIMVVKNIKEYIKGNNRNITIYVQCVFFFFYYVPLICDVIYIRPEYPKYYPGFLSSYNDFKVELIFCIIITYINYMFYIFQRKYVYKIEFKDVNINIRLTSYIIFLSITLVLIYVFFMMDQEIIRAVFSYNMRHMRTDLATQLKALSFIIIALSLIFIVIEDRQKTMNWKIVLMLPNLIFACLLNGKRTSVFMCIIGILMILILKNTIKNKKNIISIIIVSLMILLVYGNYYNKGVTQDENSYLSYRINYGRDDTLKMTIYSEMNDEKILEHRGQTLLYYLTFYIPRDLWEYKPYPYATYFTSALVGLDTVANLGWNMTTSIYDEVLSNFGWLGIILLPFVMNKILNSIAKRNEGLLGKGILFVGILDMILLIAVQASAFLFLYIALIGLIIIYDLKKRMRKKEDYG